MLASGRGTNLQAIIDAAGTVLPVDIVGVLSNNPTAQAPISPILWHSHSGCFGKDYDRRSYGEALVKQLQDWQTDLVALAGFMLLLDPVVIEAFPHRDPQYPSGPATVV